MKVGVYVFATDLVMDPGPLAKEIEQRGFDTMFFPEHSHIPAERATAYPEAYGGGVLPDFYKRTYDPFISCSFAAAATTELVVGTGIALLALRDTVHTAKLSASVDRLSGGRFVMGVGFGWNADEFSTHGADFGSRHAKVREQVQAIRTMWSDEIPEFHGEYVELKPSWVGPKPVQSPPPIYLGGSGPRTMKHAAEWADAWYPTPPMQDPHLTEMLPQFKEMVAAAGRNPDDILVGCAPGACGPEDLEAYQRNGVDVVNIYLGGDTPAETLALLDDLQKMRVDVLGK